MTLTIEEMTKERLQRFVDEPIDAGNARQPTDNAKAAAAWIGVSAERRGGTLRDLLLLVDYLPQVATSESVRFPRVESRDL